jgi:pyruvate dehydrogenase complex dehydrogenase (E1) component
MADDRADPILASYDPNAEAHITALINDDIEYVREEDEEYVSSYLNLDGEGEGREGDD